MSRTGRNSVLILIVAVLLTGLSLSAIATEEGDEGDEGASSTTTIESGLTPAVEVGQPEVAPVLTDWTYRYMIPTALALVALIVIITAVKYFTDVVRKRYRIIEE